MIRTRLGVAPVGTYKGISDCAKQVYTKEGMRAFYRGITPSMTGIIPYAGTDIATFEIVKQHMVERYDGEPPGYVLIGTGMFASSVAQFVSYPFALVRTRLQAQGMGGETNRYNGMVDVVIKTVQREGDEISTPGSPNFALRAAAFAPPRRPVEKHASPAQTAKPEARSSSRHCG